MLLLNHKILLSHLHNVFSVFCICYILKENAYITWLLLENACVHNLYLVDTRSKLVIQSME